MLAMMTTVMVSCNNDVLDDVSENKLVYDGVEYELISKYSVEQGGRVYIDAYAVETTDQGTPIFRIISDDPVSGTYDLTQGGEFFFHVSSEVDYIQEFGNHTEFSEGTMTVENNEEEFRMKVIGKLADGTFVGFHLYMPASEWVHLDF